MSNYNERLEEVLDSGIENIQDGVTLALRVGQNIDYHTFDARVELKQAITSLIKELVAEAKLEIKAHPLGPVTLADCQRGLDHYEANLLKALEEV